MVNFVWYRHWLEIRIGLKASLICAAMVCLLYPVLLLGGFNWFVASGRVTDELRAFTPRLPGMGPELFFAWATHVCISTGTALFVGFLLGGTGIRTNLVPGAGSIYYTLTLPVSRFDLMWTRFAAACAGVFVVLAAMLVFDSATLVVMGRSAPLGPMAASSLLAGLLAVPVMAVFTLLIPLWEVKAFFPVFMMAMVAMFQFWTPAARFVASPTIPWNGIGQLLLIVGAAVSIAAVVAEKKDF
jgi:hypothetical protein